MLDPSQETISLENVRCQGSEGRLQRIQQPIAQVFEYVVHVLSPLPFPLLKLHFCLFPVSCSQSNTT